MKNIINRLGAVDRFELALFFGAIAAFLLGNLTHTLAPMIVAAFTSGLNMPVSDAGFLVSLEFFGIAVMAIFVGPIIERISKKKLALVGCICALAAHIISTLITDTDILVWIRLCAGLGTGAALAAGGAAVALSVSPDRLFGFIYAGSALVQSLMLILAGYAVEQFGFRGGFGLISIFFFLLLPVLFFLPDSSKEAEKLIEEEQRQKTSLPALGQGCLTIAGTLLLVASSGLCFSFATKIGEVAGLSIQQAGSILGLSFFIAIGGSLAASWLELRVGRALPLVLGIGINGITWWMACVLPSPAVYAVCIVANSITFFFVMPYVLGIAAAIDKEGRWSAIASTSILGAMTLSPGVGGWILEQSGFAQLGLATLVGEIIALALLLLVVRRLGLSHKKYSSI